MKYYIVRIYKNYLLSDKFVYVLEHMMVYENTLFLRGDGWETYVNVTGYNQIDIHPQEERE